METIKKLWCGFWGWVASWFSGSKDDIASSYQKVLNHTFFSKTELLKVKLGRIPSEIELAEAFKEACEEVVGVMDAKLRIYQEGASAVAETADVRPVQPPPPPTEESAEKAEVVTEESSSEEGGDKEGD